MFLSFLVVNVLYRNDNFCHHRLQILSCIECDIVEPFEWKVIVNNKKINVKILPHLETWPNIQVNALFQRFVKSNLVTEFQQSDWNDLLSCIS